VRLEGLGQFKNPMTSSGVVAPVKKKKNQHRYEVSVIKLAKLSYINYISTSDEKIRVYCVEMERI
jgi:hypothetical protein